MPTSAHLLKMDLELVKGKKLMTNRDMDYLKNLRLKENSLYIVLLAPDWEVEGEDYVCAPHHTVNILF